MCHGAAALPGRTQGVRHHQLDESAWQLLRYACCETLFGSQKVERLHGQCFESRRQAKDEVIDWLLWYNRDRLHSTLAYVSRCSSKKTGLPITSTSPLMTPAMEYGIQGRGQVAPGLNCLPEVGKTSRGL